MFGGSPRLHKGLVDRLPSDKKQVRDVNNPSNKEIAKVEEDSCKAVKAALLNSGANKRQYGKLKDEHVNNYLLGSNQHPLPSCKDKHALQSQPKRHWSSIHLARRPRRPRTRWTRKGGRQRQHACQLGSQCW